MKIRMGIVGCGRQAWLGYLPWIKENPHATLAAVADIDEELLDRTERRFSAGKTYTDWRDMIDAGGIDALVITTPPWIHAGPAVAAAEKGIHIICEKPLATTVEECAQMVEAAEKNDIVFTTAHSLRFDPGYEKLKCMIAGGEIGRVFQLRATYDAWIPDLTRPPLRELVELGGRLRVFESTDMGMWRHSDERTRGGVFFDHGIHYIDMFRWLLGEKVVDVNGVVQQVKPDTAYEDHGSALMKFEGGACAYVQGSIVRMSSHFTSDTGLISGEKGCIKYDMDQTWYMRGFPHLNTAHASLWKYGLPSLALDTWFPVPVRAGRRRCMFKRQLDDFVSKVDGTFRPHPVFGDNWACTGRDGMENVRIVHEVYRTSASTDRVHEHFSNDENRKL